MSCCSATGTGAADLAAENRRDHLIASSRRTGEVYQTEFTLPVAHCIGCIKAAEAALTQLDGVISVRGNLSNRSVRATWRLAAGKAPELECALEKRGIAYALHDPAGYGAEAGGDTSRELLLGMAVAGFAAANIMLLSVSVWSGADTETAHLFHLISGLIAAPAVYIGGKPFFRSAMGAIRGRRLNMDVPISLAVLLAFAMSVFEALSGGTDVYFDAALTLLFFLSIGRYLDYRMRDRARNAALRLGRLAPRGASRVNPDGTLKFVATDAIEPGMRLRIAAGERIPTDGRVAWGTSDIDRSLVTGESLPATAEIGMVVEAGTLNLSGSLDVVALRDARHSFLAEVVQMMEAAESGRSRYIRVADRMAAIYAPAVHMLALLAFVGWMIASGGDWRLSLFVGISVLIVTCPCALGLAVPVVHVIGAGRLFDAGILMKDGSALERLAGSDMAVLDKTGTLTTGTPVVDTAELQNSTDAAAARALALHSSHPASLALRSSLDIPPASVEGVKELPGFGVEGIVNGRTVRLGRASWVSEIAAGQKPDLAGTAFAAQGKRIRILPLEEQLRHDAAVAVGALRRLHLQIEILSGDSADSVKRISEELGVGTYRHSLTPSGKIDRIEALRAKGHSILVVGDGLNDAAALACGDVSFAPATASDAGRMAADFVFTRQSFSAIPFAVTIARKAAKLVRQNFALALLYNCIAVPLAMAGLVSPLLAAIAMSASSIVVVGNSMRLTLGLHLTDERNVPETAQVRSAAPLGATAG